MKVIYEYKKQQFAEELNNNQLHMIAARELRYTHEARMQRAKEDKLDLLRRQIVPYAQAGLISKADWKVIRENEVMMKNLIKQLKK